MVKTAVLVSGGGSNLQSLIDARVFGELGNCDLAAVISTSPDAYALTRAEIAGIPSYIVERDMFPSASVFGFAMVDKLRDLDIELVVLAGYNCELTQPIFKRFGGRIVDTYPSLMPAFTEASLSSEDVCAEALRTGVKLTGATAYFVTETPRRGPIIVQKAVEVMEDDTPSTLRRRVLEEGENYVLPRALELFCQDRLTIQDGVVHISGACPEKQEG